MKYTVLFVTVNTNIPVMGLNGFETQDFIAANHTLKESISSVLGQPIHQATFQALGVEVGDNQHRLHCHFMLTLETKRGFHLRGVNLKLQHYYNSLSYGIFALSKGVYVNAKLHDRGKTLNYAQKGAHALTSRSFQY